MVLLDYFEEVFNGIEFLIALGSILGLLGFIVGLLSFMFGGPRIRMKMLGLIITSIILIAVCGLHTGTKYFRIH
ncbi:hypothetical protein ES705_23283 [subsurface metagenome]